MISTVATRFFFSAARFFFHTATRILFLTVRKKLLCQEKKILAVRKELNGHKIKKNFLGISNHFWENIWVAVISAKNHKRQRRKCQSVTAREKSQTPKVLTAILTLPILT